MHHVNLDFETYSEAGYVFDHALRRWVGSRGAKKGGLDACGGAVYVRHPSTRILSAAYSIDGGDVRLWVPGLFQPDDLLEAVRAGALVWAWNSPFEFGIWNHVARRMFNWPALPLEQTRDTMAVSRTYGLPGKLKVAAPIVGKAKLAEGKSLINRFSKPKAPSAKDPSLRRMLADDPERAALMFAYNVQDVRVEMAVKASCPPMSPVELEVWHVDQTVNERGVAVDIDAAKACQSVVDEYFERLTGELVTLTGGELTSTNQVARVVKFLGDRGVTIPDLTAETVEQELKHGGTVTKLPPWARRILEIRQALGLASVKKLRAMLNTLCDDGRIRGLFAYAGAGRTWRWAGRGAQPQNMPKGAADVVLCGSCALYQGAHRNVCYACGGATLKGVEWGFEVAREAIAHVKTRPSLDAFADRWGDVLGTIAGCLRSMFVAAEGHRLVCSDFRSIEAVVLAQLSGEQWRIDAFHASQPMYEMSASKIKGVPLQTYLDYKAEHKAHHPDRKIGKVAELASGYQGSIDAWKRPNFGAGEFMTDDEIKVAVKAWRKESPKIVAMWYGLEREAIRAVKNPGIHRRFRDITYHYDGRVLRCVLPSGRALVYQQPSIHRVDKWGSGEMSDELRFMGYNSDPTKGAMGWVQLRTYGGKLTENVVQAVARDLMAWAMVQAERWGYRIVLHVHDEIVCEMPNGSGSIVGLESIMGTLPPWARGWPVIAAGGWEGREYRKD